jgi:CelD/BcsL family acetyltransferase involved in cellulose biosynthesis
MSVDSLAICDPMWHSDVHPSIEPVYHEWEALADRTGASPFLRAEWIGAWQKHFWRAPVQVLSVQRNGRVVALLPFIRRWGTVRSPTNFHTPEFGAVAEDREAANVLFRSLFAQPRHTVSLSFLEEDGRDVVECLAAAAGHRNRTVIRIQQRSPYIDLTGTSWPEYENALAPKLRSDLRRRSRKLDQMGQVTFEVTDGRENLDRLLEEGFHVEPSEWKARRGTAITSRHDTKMFYVDAARWAARRGILRLAFIRLDGRPIAFQFGLEDLGTYYFLKGGYDVSFRHVAPGKLLVRSMLARAFEHGLQRFEFLGAAESWKSEWATSCRRRVVISAFGPGPLGQACWFATRFARPLAKRLAHAWRRPHGHRIAVDETRSVGEPRAGAPNDDCSGPGYAATG